MASSSSNGGFCYSDAVSSGNNPTVLMNHIHSFVSEPADMFNLTSGMENMTGFSKNLLPQQQIHDSVMWQQNNRTLLVDDSSSFRPSQGLSLSLSSSNPSSIGLQSFELRHHHHHHHHQAPLLQEEGVQHFVIKNSKFLLPTQDLLNEFCSLGTKLNDSPNQKHSQRNFNKQLEEENPNKHSLGSLEFAELQKRKTKLLSMLEEVERRYKHYCNQMKAVVSTFEAVAGNGAATVYSALALKAMSRHFRCLKDGIMEQIQGTRKAMGEKDPVAPGTTKGETPRLKIIDQTLRQQRAFQQINMMETHPWRPQRGLPERSVSLLRAWLFEHFLHPYPTDVDKHILAHQTGLSKSQVSNWFINARVRLWKPMVEEMYLEEEKDQKENKSSSEDINQLSPSVLPVAEDDQKPTQARLLRIDSDCVSSIVNNSDHHKHDPKNMNVHEQDTFGSIHELDFSSYTHHSSGMVSYGTSNDHDGNNQSLLHGGGSVSLTLGLPQDGGRGVNLAFQPETQGAMFYQRDHMEESHEYSLLDGEGQNGNIMPYRNLMGTQLLNQY